MGVTQATMNACAPSIVMRQERNQTKCYVEDVEAERHLLPRRQEQRQLRQAAAYILTR